MLLHRRSKAIHSGDKKLNEIHTFIGEQRRKEFEKVCKLCVYWWNTETWKKEEKRSFSFWTGTDEESWEKNKKIREKIKFERNRKERIVGVKKAWKHIEHTYVLYLKEEHEM